MARTKTRQAQIRDDDYKELTYNPDGTLAQLVVKDSTETHVLVTKQFTYLNGDLTQITVTYEDGTVVTKDFSYTAGQLDNLSTSEV